jgi:UDPglucose 6-dehydrogenase
MKIVMVGAGYVGLVTGACLAEWGNEVVCVDVDERKINGLQRGRIPIYEPGLDELVARNAAEGRISFTCRLGEALEKAEIVIVAVGTPSRERDGEANLAYVFQAAREIAGGLRDDAVVVIKSTVPVGTGQAVERIIASACDGGIRVAVASNPEFLREGCAIADFLKPDRVVIGSEDDHAVRTLLALYAPLATTTPILVTGRKTAELIKYAANAFLATKITFINEMADLCERAEADVRELAMGVGLDHRIGTSFLNAGPGYGGSCFPKDTLALLRTAQDLGVSLRIVEETVTSNDARKRKMALKVSEAVGGCVDGLTIAVLGLSFKPDTDDMRDAPSIPLVEALQRMGASVRAHDPVGMERAKEVFEDVAFFDDAYTCASGVDAVVLVTDWNEFRHLDLRKLRNVMLGDVLVDLRNIIDVDHARRHGLKVTNLGVRNGEPTTPVPAGVARTIPAEVKKEIRHDQT